MEKRKIMVIDDDMEFQSELKELLVLQGYKVITVTETRLALPRAKKTKPDIIILDIKLKGSSGLDVFENLKNSRATADIPVIGITGVYGKSQDIIQICGIKECLIKPFNPEVLIDKLEIIFENKIVKREFRRIKEIEKTLNFSVPNFNINI